MAKLSLLGAHALTACAPPARPVRVPLTRHNRSGWYQQRQPAAEENEPIK